MLASRGLIDSNTTTKMSYSSYRIKVSAKLTVSAHLVSVHLVSVHLVSVHLVSVHLVSVHLVSVHTALHVGAGAVHSLELLHVLQPVLL